MKHQKFMNFVCMLYSERDPSKQLKLTLHVMTVKEKMNHNRTEKTYRVAAFDLLLGHGINTYTCAYSSAFIS